MPWKYWKHIMSTFHFNLSPFMFFFATCIQLDLSEFKISFDTLSLLWIMQFVQTIFSIRVGDFLSTHFHFHELSKMHRAFSHQSSRIPSTHFYLRMQGLGCLGTSSSWVQRTRQGDLYQWDRIEFYERGLLSYLQLPLVFDLIIKSRNKVAQCQGSSAWMGIVFIPPHVNSIYSFSDLPSWGPWDWPWQER